MLLAGSSFTRFKSDTVIHIFSQVISGSRGIFYRLTVLTSFKHFYRGRFRPCHTIIYYGHSQTRVTIRIRVFNHFCITPVKSCTICHFISTYQVFCRTSGSRAFSNSHREVCRLKTCTCSRGTTSLLWLLVAPYKLEYFGSRLYPKVPA